MKTAIVIGHHLNGKGAYSPHFKMNEFDFYDEVVDCIPNTDIYMHDPNIRSYTARIKNTARQLNKKDYDLVIELHFNSSDSPQANGCETLYYNNSVKGKKYALLFSELVHRHTNITLRRKDGLKPIKKEDRGYASVYYPKAPAILIEPFFGSNKNDCDLIGSTENLAFIINDFLRTLRKTNHYA